MTERSSQARAEASSAEKWKMLAFIPSELFLLRRSLQDATRLG
jgi:hypothetical protein